MPDCRLSRLVVTKSLNKGAEYALGKGGLQNETSDVELAARMKKRDAGSAPQMGDRVPYVIITGAKGAANFEKAEDSIFVLDTNMPIDCKWYLTNRRCTSVDSFPTVPGTPIPFGTIAGPITKITKAFRKSQRS